MPSVVKKFVETTFTYSSSGVPSAPAIVAPRGPFAITPENDVDSSRSARYSGYDQ